MEKAIIKFSNGNEIEIEKNASTYIADSKEEVVSAIGQSNDAIITTETETIEVNPFRLVDCASVDGRYWFGLNQISDVELNMIKLNAQIEYTAMMTDTELEV